MQEDQLTNAIDRVFAATSLEVEQLQTMTYEQLVAWATQNPETQTDKQQEGQHVSL